MTLNEWITTNPTNILWNQIKTKWINFANYINYKFGNYEIKYPSPIFIDKLFSICMGFSLELNAMEVPQELTSENIGTTIKSSLTSNYENDGNNTQSYAGYNVEGDFEKNTNTNTSTTINKDDKNITNLYSYLSKANSNIFRQQWRNIEKEISSLFILYVF